MVRDASMLEMRKAIIDIGMALGRAVVLPHFRF